MCAKKCATSSKAPKSKKFWWGIPVSGISAGSWEKFAWELLGGTVFGMPKRCLASADGDSHPSLGGVLSWRAGLTARAHSHRLRPSSVPWR
ncbi:hypothetical protein ACP_0437 [Acidobacterium capsulatum ATCC 51196]|uniref:Uncharacterized protein n=1 Tax=Acidobacterium capsulatum (strain ATCC 51196 / DSM 11244 / BCRC 80197 / JCM 7670 / NBRC 15755 / NCIMB 13165 / 161) TaxID=240015 RepID=C1F0U0_ACIC5|nr:hypothetical protein ACP_0437 [Acidobacterium capsulatum ATCC 51196]